MNVRVKLQTDFSVKANHYKIVIGTYLFREADGTTHMHHMLRT